MKKNKSVKESSNIAEIMNLTFEKTNAIAGESVFGEPISKDGVTVIPVSKISAGFAGGGAEIKKRKKSNLPADAGARIAVTPTHFVQISGGKATLVSAVAPSQKPDTAALVIKTLKNLIKKK